MSNFKVGETVVCKEVGTSYPGDRTYGFYVGCECVIREISPNGGLRFFNMPDYDGVNNYWCGDCFEKKQSTLSMQFKEKVHEERKTLILQN